MAQAKPHNDDEFDYIIVGAGSAGCVLAHRLTASGKYNVLLLEAGGDDNHFWIHIPLGYGKLFRDPKRNWMYNGVPEKGLNDRTIFHPRGKVLGGSSSINGLLYVRGQKEDFDEWAAAGNTGWGFDDVLPYFIRSENQENGANEYHGNNGPQYVSNATAPHPLCDAYIEACQEYGLPLNDDFNGASQEGTGYYQSTTHKGRRWSTAKGYLDPVKGRKNLEIRTHAHATRILFDGKRVIGIEYDQHGQSHQVYARGEVLLAAGAINSPQLMELSGIGDQKRLSALGIETLHHAPQVGENLQDHLQVRTIFRSKLKNSFNDQYNNFFRRIGVGLEYFLQRKGPLTVSAGYAGSFYKTSPELATPDIQSLMIIFSTNKMGDKLHDFSGYTASYYQLRPESRGHLHITSNDPYDHPDIWCNYLGTETDRHVNITGLRKLRKIMNGKAMGKYRDVEIDPGADVQSDDELLGYIRSTASTVYHPSSTCIMGANGDAVVTPELKVRGVEGLRVIDGSILPSMISGNLNAAIIMIGEKGADLVLKDGR